jgi:hypothetical protein
MICYHRSEHHLWSRRILAVGLCLALTHAFACGDDVSTPDDDSGTVLDGMADPDTGTGDSGTVDPDAGDGDAGTVDPDAGTGTEDAGLCPPADSPNELISDRHFSRGFVAKDPDSGDALGTLNPAFAPGDTVWNLGQWGSQTSMDAATPTTLSSGAIRWEDLYGAVTIGQPCTSDADLSLRVNAFEEYGGVYVTFGPTRTWAHLLGEQRLSPPGTVGPGCPPLSELAALDFSVDGRLIFDQPNHLAGYDPSQHAAHYLIYFTVQNLNTSSAGYGDYLWFGLTLYDDRDPMPGLSILGDGATGKLIYNIGLAPLSGGGLDDLQWHGLSGDLLPHIRAALLEAWSRGYLVDSNVLSDYRIGGMNLGWEVPGLNNVELQMRDLSLTYTDQAFAEVRYDFNIDGDTEGWTTSNITAPVGGPAGGLWVMSVPGSDPVWISPPVKLDASSYSSLSVTVANNGNPLLGSRLQVFWSRFGDPGFREADSASVDISNTGAWATYTIDLTLLPNWTGEITGLRIDPILYGDGHTVGVDSIVLTP